jgi:5'-phosphate synthase pdxT subunit
MRKTRIGVLSLQGAFQLHQWHLENAGAEYKEVVTLKDFEKIDGLILPGGESSTMLKLINTVGIGEVLVKFFKSKPIWGICAGAILMAKTVQNPPQKSFGIIDITIERNAYGHQLESFQGKVKDYEVSYIRAPKILSIGNSVNVHAAIDRSPVWIESDNLSVTTFHPETNRSIPSPWHQHLIKKCQAEK